MIIDTWYNYRDGDYMANVQKYTRADVGGGSLTRHYERAKDKNGQYHKWGNQEIDPSLSHLNYNLAPEREQGQLSFISGRISEVKCHNRDDVNIMCSWVVTAPKCLDKSEYKRFFRESYNFLCRKYEEKNVVSAWVHMDEKTPHIHFAFIPVVVDKKKRFEKVSAKEALGWSERGLYKFHGELDCYMATVFGRDIGILNEATKEGNKSIYELKRRTSEKKIKILEARISDLERVFGEKSKTLINVYEKQKNAIQSKIEALEGQFKGVALMAQHLNSIQPEKTLLGTIKGVTLEDIQSLKSMAISYIQVVQKLERYKKAYDKLNKSYDADKKNIPGITEGMKLLKDKNRLEELERVFKELPPEIREQLFPTNTQSFELSQ